MPGPARPPRERRRDVLERLERDVDLWVATGDEGTGTPRLVPLSFNWDGETLLLATPAASPYLYFRIRPRRLQAWREANELEGRVLMSDGRWIVSG